MHPRHKAKYRDIRRQNVFATCPSPLLRLPIWTLSGLCLCSHLLEHDLLGPVCLDLTVLSDDPAHRCSRYGNSVVGIAWRSEVHLVRYGATQLESAQREDREMRLSETETSDDLTPATSRAHMTQASHVDVDCEHNSARH